MKRSLVYRSLVDESEGTPHNWVTPSRARGEVTVELHNNSASLAKAYVNKGRKDAGKMPPFQ